MSIPRSSSTTGGLGEGNQEGSGRWGWQPEGSPIGHGTEAKKEEGRPSGICCGAEVGNEERNERGEDSPKRLVPGQGAIKKSREDEPGAASLTQQKQVVEYPKGEGGREEASRYTRTAQGSGAAPDSRPSLRSQVAAVSDPG